MSFSKQVEMPVNFNGQMVRTAGTVLRTYPNMYLVSFEHEGVTFRGLWPIASCVNRSADLVEGSHRG